MAVIVSLAPRIGVSAARLCYPKTGSYKNLLQLDGILGLLCTQKVGQCLDKAAEYPTVHCTYEKLSGLMVKRET